MLEEANSGEESPELLKAHQVADRLSISERTLWRLIKRGKFPGPIRYSRRMVRWKTSDLNTWLDRQGLG
jgi:excisionase family DNA binding protein